MSDTQQFIFGYGSLIESHSRALTSADALHALPVNVSGIQRGWFGQIGGSILGPTYLAAFADPNSCCNGVIFKVSAQQLKAFDEYETGYGRERIDQSNITMLGGSGPAEDGVVWFYTSPQKHSPSPEFPITQSYLDTCLNGCFEIEAAFPLAKAAEFAAEFLKTTTNWSKNWVNDRINQPNADRIDQLLNKVVSEQMCSRIEIEPAG